MKGLWKYLPKYLGMIALVVIVIWAARGAEVNAERIITGFPNILKYLGRMVPPDGPILVRIGRPLTETFQIAIVSILSSSIIALPLSFFAARNIMTNRFVYQVMRGILGVLRGIPALLYAIFFVAMVGLGPFAGVLALTFHNVGVLGRFFSEAIENINPEIMNAAKAAGANKTKTVIHIVVPELSALFLGYILYYFESNVRAATILGLVGAGGIGLLLVINIHLFKYNEVATIMLVLVTIIVIMDRLSTMVRTKFIKGEVVI